MSKDPGRASALDELLVSLNVLVPVLNKNPRFTVFGDLNQRHPAKLPKLSVTKRTSFTVA